MLPAIRSPVSKKYCVPEIEACWKKEQMDVWIESGGLGKIQS